MSNRLFARHLRYKNAATWHSVRVSQRGLRHMTWPKPAKPNDEHVLRLLQEIQEDLNTPGSDGDSFNHGGSTAREEENVLENMPLSPLMDPNLIKARKRHLETKSSPSKEKTEFQSRLERNPYGILSCGDEFTIYNTDVITAHILSTPVRNCTFTGIRMPSFFHLPFGLRRHPRTGKPWYLPLSLEPTQEELAQEEARNVQQGHPQNQAQTPTEPAKPSPHPITEDDKASPIPETSISTSIKAPDSPKNDRQPFLSSSYIISQLPALTHITTLKTRDFSRIIPVRWKDAPGADINVREIVWREDMDTFALELMRKRAVHLLSYLGEKRKARYIQLCLDYGRLESHHQIGAVLWLGNQEEEGVSVATASGGEGNGEGSLAEPINSPPETFSPVPSTPPTSNAPPTPSSPPPIPSTDPQPPPYATVLYKGHHIPLFNLRHLLGDEHLQSLRELGDPFDGKLAVVKAKRNTVPLLMWLWKLMGFLGEGKGRRG